jgi:two-component system, sensor histidine kinase and response regulator
MLEGLIVGNIAISQERLGKFQDAIKTYHEAIELARKSQYTVGECRAWNNLAFVYERQEQFEKAKHAYEKALELAYKTNDSLMLGLTLANLAELDKDYDALKEALLILDKAGYVEAANRFRRRLPQLAESSGETSDRPKL